MRQQTNRSYISLIKVYGETRTILNKQVGLWTWICCCGGICCVVSVVVVNVRKRTLPSFWGWILAPDLAKDSSLANWSCKSDIGSHYDPLSSRKRLGLCRAIKLIRCWGVTMLSWFTRLKLPEIMAALPFSWMSEPLSERQKHCHLLNQRMTNFRENFDIYSKLCRKGYLNLKYFKHCQPAWALG